MTKINKKKETQQTKLADVKVKDDVPPTNQADAEVDTKRDLLAEPGILDDTANSLPDRVASLEASLLRAKADYQNLQRRTMQEKSDAIRYANLDLMRSLVGVLDDFDRAIESLEASEANKNTVEGIRLVHQNFFRALTDFGMEQLAAIDKTFDPHLHDAMLEQPSKAHDPGVVIQEIAKGYRLGDRIIRPSKVVVAKMPDEADES